MIDWNGKLEAVHKDGRVMPILSVKGPDFQGDYAVSPAPDGRDCFRADGSKWIGEITGYDTGWTIRNTPVTTPTPDERAVASELVERMRKLVEQMAGNSSFGVPFLADNDIKWDSRHYDEARAIVAALEPVDEDLVEARRIACDNVPSWDENDEIECVSGKYDNNLFIVIAEAAIKRGRQLEKEGKL